MSSAPTPYTRQANFLSWETTHPTVPKPGTDLDAEFDAVKVTSDETRDRLAEIQRDDGKLRNESVHLDALAPNVLAMMAVEAGSIRGGWAPGVAYQAKDVVDYTDGNSYIAVIDHLASGSFSTDEGAGKWIALTGGGVGIGDGGENNTASNVGGGVGLFKAKSGVNLQFKTLVAGANVTLTPVGDTVVVDSDGGGVGGAPDWGDIGGSLAAQTDLADALGEKASTLHTHGFASITGKPTTVAGYGIADLGAAPGSGLVGYSQSGTGSSTRTVQTVLRERHLSVMDFGAVGDGIADDAIAIQAAINEAVARGAADVYFPPGTYRTTALFDPITVSNVRLVGAGGDRIKDSAQQQAATTLVYDGVSAPATSALLTFATPAGASNTARYGQGVLRMAIQLQARVGIGIKLHSVKGFTCEEVVVIGPTAAAYWLTCLHTPTIAEPSDIQNCFFKKVQFRCIDPGSQSAHGFRLTSDNPGTTQGNVSLNQFHDCSGQVFNGTGIYIDDGDNNQWFGARIYSIGAGYGIDIRGIGVTDSNSFYGLTCSGANKIRIRGTASGYINNPTGTAFILPDTSNSTQPPLADAGIQFVFFTDRGVHYSLRGTQAALSETANQTSLQSGAITNETLRLHNGSENHVRMTDGTREWGMNVNAAGNFRIVRASGTGYIDMGGGAPVKIAGNVGFYGTAPTNQPGVAGYVGSVAQQQAVVTALATLGLITNTTTAPAADMTNALHFSGVDPTGVASSSAGLQTAINAAAGATLVIPKGTYKLSSALLIPSNTTIIAYGASFVRSVTTLDNMLRNDSSGATGSYGANSGITIMGGAWDSSAGNAISVMAFGHCTGVTIRDVEIASDTRYHHIEVNACDEVLIEGCRFTGGFASALVEAAGGSPYNATLNEAIQIDAMVNSGAFPWFGPYDSTPCKNVTIRDCVFKDVGSGVGTHSDNGLGAHTGIKIVDCKFANVYDCAIKALSWWDIQVTGCRFEDVYCGVYVTRSTNRTARDITISGNTFYRIGANTTNPPTAYREACAVKVEGVNTDVTKNSRNIRVVGNVVDGVSGANSGSGIRLDYVYELATVANNTVIGMRNSGIYIYGGALVSVTGNSAKSNNVAAGAHYDILMGNTGVSTDMTRGVIVGNTVGTIGIVWSQASIVRDNNVYTSLTESNNASTVKVGDNLVGNTFL